MSTLDGVVHNMTVVNYLVEGVDYDYRWPRVDIGEGATSQLYRGVEACRQVGLLKHKCVA